MDSSFFQSRIDHLIEQKKKIAAAKQSLATLGSKYDALTDQLHAVITEINTEIEDYKKNSDVD